MKARYIVALAIIILATILFEYLMLAHPMGDSATLGNAIQAAAVFVALLAAVAAIAASDPKPKQVNVGIEPYISTGEAATHSKTELPDSLIAAFAHLQDTFQSYRVHFRLTNHSGFTLVAPTITLRLPIDRRHPHRVDGHFIATFNSNLFNSQEALRVLEFGETQILSNSNLPYWNDKDQITIWVRMTFGLQQSQPFSIEVSVNCENGQGTTKKVELSSNTPRT
jgi:hypothetical protein